METMSPKKWQGRPREPPFTLLGSSRGMGMGVDKSVSA